MKLKFFFCAVPAALFSLSAFNVWSADSGSVDCSTAQADLDHLKHEKKSTDERAVKGVMSILPIGLAINAISSAEKHDDKKEMDIKEYNQKLTDRIAEIKQKCNIQ